MKVDIYRLGVINVIAMKLLFRPIIVIIDVQNGLTFYMQYFISFVDDIFGAVSKLFILMLSSNCYISFDHKELK